MIWYFDSGASRHITSRKDLFCSLDAAPAGKKVTCANNASYPIRGVGKILITISDGSDLCLPDVLYVPGIKKNLLSVSSLAKNGLWVIFEDDRCIVRDRENGYSLITTGTLENGLFVLDRYEKQIQACIAETKTQAMQDAELWHARFGHVGYGSLMTLQRHNMVHDLSLLEMPPRHVCEGCVLGKMHRFAFSQDGSVRATPKLQLVHSDVAKYTLRTDRGGEYMSGAFKDFLGKKGIKHQCTMPYTPQQNGVAERKNRSLMEMARCMLKAKSLPHKLWMEAVACAAHVLNRCPTRALKTITPYESWYDRKPSVSYLHVFGCLAYAHIPQQLRGKLDDKAVKCIFVWYSSGSKGYRLYNPATNKIFESRDVIFAETTAQPMVAFDVPHMQTQDVFEGFLPSFVENQESQQVDNFDQSFDQHVTPHDVEEIVREEQEVLREERTLPKWVQKTLQDSKLDAPLPRKTRADQHSQNLIKELASRTTQERGEPSKPEKEETEEEGKNGEEANENDDEVGDDDDDDEDDNDEENFLGMLRQKTARQWDKALYEVDELSTNEKSHVPDEVLAQIPAHIFITKFRDEEDDNIKTTIMPRDNWTLHKRPKVASAVRAVHLEQFFRLPPWGTDYMRAHELMSSIQYDGKAMLTDSDGAKVEVLITKEIINKALQFLPGAYDLIPKTKAIDNKKAFLKVKGSKFKYSNLIYSELELPLRLISQHFRVQKPPRYTEPFLHMAVVMALCVAKRRQVHCDYAKFILESLIEANLKNSAKNKLYMNAGPMLTRVAYQALGMIKDLPAASSQAALIQQAKYVPKAIRTITSAASSRSTKSKKSSSDEEHTDRDKLRDLIDLQSQLTRKEAQNHELIKNEKKMKEQLKYEDARFQKLKALYNTVKTTLTALLQNQEPASAIPSTSDSATANTLATLQEELQTEKLQRQLLVSGFMTQTAQHKAKMKQLELELAQARGKNKALLNYPILSAQEPPTVTYVVNTLNQTIQLLREVPDLTCQMLVKIAKMIVTCIQVFRDTEDDDHPWNLFLEGRRGICWNLRDSPPRWIIMAIYSRLMYLPSHFLQTFKEAFVTGFFKISTQIFHPMAKDLKARYIAYQNTLAENPFRQQQEDIAFATRKRSFLAQVAALEPQQKSKQ
ncbi:hypothetical protein L7F22_001465 [Adiantum nelumboides]|nr:hypothetical protein [Adiantum nelumboides]